MLKMIKISIRKKAIMRAENRIIVAGRSISDFSAEEVEVLIREEEDKIYSQYKTKAFTVAGALVGMSIGIGN